MRSRWSFIGQPTPPSDWRAPTSISNGEHGKPAGITGWFLAERTADDVSGAAGAKTATARAEAQPDMVGALYREQAASLVRLARIFTDDRNAAEDLVQEAFIRFQRNAHRLRDAEKALPYLRSIVLNLARDHNRRGLMSLRHLEASLEPTETSVEGAAIVSENRREVLAAVLELPTRQRDSIVLRFYLDLGDRQIADTLGISVNSVKTHLRRALASLQKALGAAQ